MIYETTATLEIDGQERDYPVRARVVLEHGAGMGGSFGATIDGDIEACIDGAWVDVDMIPLDARMRERLEESFAELAFQDGDTRADEGDYR